MTSLSALIAQVQAETETLRAAVQEWADGKIILFETDSAVVDAVNAILADAPVLAAALKDAREILDRIAKAHATADHLQGLARSFLERHKEETQ